MKQFEMEILIAGQPGIFRAEELDPWPDPDGYVRYGLTAAGAQSVISLDAHYWSKTELATNLSQRPFFSDNNVFSNGELRRIAKYIAYANQ